MPTKKGILISFEGIDKCGKKTQMLAVKDWLESAGKTVFSISHPNDQTSPMGQHIRDILQHKIPFPGNLELQRMFTVDQSQSWHCWIQPALEQGFMVLAERYHHSTLAYSLAFGIAEFEVTALRRNIIGSTFQWPDLTFLVDITPEEAMRRFEVTKSQREYFEKEDRLKWARNAYLFIARRGHDDRVVVIDGQRPQEEVTAEIKAIITQNFF